jgi:hypothetical protein
MQPELPLKEIAPQEAIISIGPQTDAVLDALKFRDEILPHLHFLIRHTRSRLWETELRKEQWQLSGEQAKQISRALIADVSVVVSYFYTLFRQPKKLCPHSNALSGHSLAR